MLVTPQVSELYPQNVRLFNLFYLFFFYQLDKLESFEQRSLS